MTGDPMATFGSLLSRCISDNSQERGWSVALEGVAFLLLGVLSSAATAYAFSALGLV